MINTLLYGRNPNENNIIGLSGCTLIVFLNIPHADTGVQKLSQFLLVTLIFDFRYTHLFFSASTSSLSGAH